MKKSTSAIIVVLVVVVILVIVAIVYGGNHGSGVNGTATNPTPTTAAQDTGAPADAQGNSAGYTSTADNFSINFPGTPTAINLTFDSPTAGTVPYTEYKVASSGTAYYAVYAYQYPQTYTFGSDYLSGALETFDSFVKAKFPGATIASQTPTQFLGNSALSALITIPKGDGAIGDDYLLITTQGHEAYIISTYGLPQSDFQAFLNSFAFL